MNTFIIEDPHMGGYYKTYIKRVSSIPAAKHWKRISYALAEAALINVSRNIPPGHTGPSKHYSKLPNAQVLELDWSRKIVAVHPAPPQYISVTTQ